MKILVTGGAGYIGSHTCLVLLEAGHEVVVVDNLSNGSEEALRRVMRLANRPLRFVKGDIRDKDLLRSAFEPDTDAVIHFAALKAVGESVSKPLEYYENNIAGAVALMQVMRDESVDRLVFSSSATVYGHPDSLPIGEQAPLRATNPYGRTKLFVEQMISDWSAAQASLSAVLLRYFNPVGAHESGDIGEDPLGEPGNLMPYLAQVAVGRRQKLRIYGTDYPTKDGTGVRDYIHVMDLAEAHVRAVEYAAAQKGCEEFNVGTGSGHSVLDVVESFERVSGISIPVEAAERRPGDIAQLTADPTKAKNILGWVARHGLTRMCEDVWRWQSKNPKGYEV